MEKVAILIEAKNGDIKQSNFGVITAAHGDDRELYAFLIGGNITDQKAPNHINHKRTPRKPRRYKPISKMTQPITTQSPQCPGNTNKQNFPQNNSPKLI